MSTWSLDVNGSTSTFGTLGLQRYDLVLASLASDTLDLVENPTALNTVPVLQYGQTIKLIQDSTIRFIGTVVTSPKTGLPGQIEARRYSTANVIWNLDHLIYEQDWHATSSTTKYKGRVQLGRDVDNNRLEIGEAIKDILDFAIAEGLALAYVQADLDALDTTPPDQEAVDITCFEAIKALLNWSPSVATNVEYATGSPVIRFTKRGAATPVDLASEDLAALDITPRYDIQLNGCVINFEITSEVDGDRYTDIVQQTAGLTTGINILKQTIDLQGIQSSTNYQEAAVVVDSSPDATNSSFWLNYLPGLSQVTDLSIDSGTNPAALGSYPNVLISGSVPSWTQKSAVSAEFTATISGKLGGKSFTGLPISVQLTLTDAISKTYKQIVSSSYRPGETPPADLALNIYNERKTLHYSGSATRIMTEPDFSIGTGNTLNLTAPAGSFWDDSAIWDDSALWDDGNINGMLGLDAINAVIESIRISRSPKGTVTTINFGPPRHLQAQDFIAIARASRNIRTSVWNRKEPLGDNDAKIDASGATPNNNASTLGDSVPTISGASTGQVLAIANASTNTMEWIDAPSGVPSGGSNGDVLAIISGIADWLDSTGGGVLLKDTLGLRFESQSSSGYYLESVDSGGHYGFKRGVLPPAMGSAGAYLLTGDGTTEVGAWQSLGSSAEIIIHDGDGTLTLVSVPASGEYILRVNGGTVEFKEISAVGSESLQALCKDGSGNYAWRDILDTYDYQCIQ